MKFPLIASVGLATAVVAFSGVASADPYYRHGYRDYFGTASASFVYGFWTGDGDVNAFAPGFNARLGFTLGSGLYLGGDFDWFFGESHDTGVAGVNASSHVGIYDVMGEIGYDFWVHRHGIIRPKIGLGVGVLHGNACGAVDGIGSICDDRSRSGFAIAPGIEYLHFFDSLFLTVEGRYETVSISDIPDPNAIIVGVGLGVIF